MSYFIKMILFILCVSRFEVSFATQIPSSKYLPVTTIESFRDEKKYDNALQSIYGFESNNSLLSLDKTTILATGGWSGGGGTGIACWSNTEDAKVAQYARTQKLPLPKELYERIKTLEVTEFWENRDKKFVQPLVKETSNIYLQRILNVYFSNIAPSFKTKLEQALLQIDSSEEKLSADQYLMQIEDTGPIKNYAKKEFTDYCSVVQIATRYARTINDVVETKFLLDFDLYNKLGLREGVLRRERQVINQALLRLHEGLYLLGYNLNQSTSEKVRGMSSYLVLQESYASLLKVLGEAFAISPTESTLTGLQKYAILMILYHKGFGEVPFIGSGSRSPRKQQLKDSYKKYHEGLGELNQSLEKLNLSEPFKAQFKSSSFAIWMSELKQSDAYIGAVMALMMGDEKIKDIYELLDPNLDTRDQEQEICQLIDKWLLQFGNPQSQNASLTVKMFRNAQQYCSGR